jgi:cysteine-rich repeat protein
MGLCRIAAVGVLLICSSSYPAALRADEIDLSGTWQVNAGCGPVTGVSTIAISENVATGAFSATTTNCGTTFLENGIHVFASCTTTPVNGAVSGLTSQSPTSGLFMNDALFETPFTSSLLGCVSSPCAREVLETATSGTITLDGMGAAIQVNGTVTVAHVQIFDTMGNVTLDLSSVPGCTFVMLRSDVSAGTSVTVNPYPDTSLTFDTVITPGVVQLTPLTSPAAEVPANFQLFDLPIYYDVTTTAVFAGTAALCIPYDDHDNDGFVDNTTPPIDENSLLILHQEGGVFVDRTVSRDTGANKICGAVTSFSQFVLGAATGASVCGNGMVDLGEQCDDGNAVGGDCCSATCQYEPAGSSCPSDGDACTDDVCNATGLCGVDISSSCDDHNPCTQDSCDSIAGCQNVPGPASGCRTAGKSILLLKHDAANAASDKLLWKWIKGQSTTRDDLADPTATTPYTLCLYDAAHTLLGNVAVPPGATHWSALSDKGFKLNDPAGSAGGLEKILLKSGAQDKAKALIKGGGANLPDPPLGSLTLPVTVQLFNRDTGVCLEGAFDTAGVVKNDARQFKAKQ